MGIMLLVVGMLLLPLVARAQSPRIGVDPRVELLAIIFKFAGNREFNQNNFRQYHADVERHFGPFKGHEAVTLARELRERHGTGFSRVMSIAILRGRPRKRKHVFPKSRGRHWAAHARPSSGDKGSTRRERHFALGST